MNKSHYKLGEMSVGIKKEKEEKKKNNSTDRRYVRTVHSCNPKIIQIVLPSLRVCTYVYLHHLTIAVRNVGCNLSSINLEMQRVKSNKRFEAKHAITSNPN